MSMKYEEIKGLSPRNREKFENVISVIGDSVELNGYMDFIGAVNVRGRDFIVPMDEVEEILHRVTGEEFSIVMRDENPDTKDFVLFIKNPQEITSLWKEILENKLKDFKSDDVQIRYDSDKKTLIVNEASVQIIGDVQHSALHILFNDFNTEILQGEGVDLTDVGDKYDSNDTRENNLKRFDNAFREINRKLKENGLKSVFIIRGKQVHLLGTLIT